MTSKRSYRDAITKENIIKELINCKGTHFDPMLVDELIKVLKDY
jgi:response regulator RpfG family c-di-GMP phosphodiesterase